MKKIQKIMTILMATMIILTATWPVQAKAADTNSNPPYEYEDGFESGYQAGWRDGYKDGSQDGYEEGTQDGYEDGCEAGYNAGVDSIIGWVAEEYDIEEEALRAMSYWDSYYGQTPQEDWEYSDYAEFYTDESDEVELFEYEDIH